MCVTGGLGFIGGHLCRALALTGHDVVCIDRSRNGRQAVAAAELAALPGVEVMHADLALDPLGPVLGEADAVIHLAALPGVRERRSRATVWRENVDATARVLDALDERCRFVLASTSSIYGDAAVLPTPEVLRAAPLNPYAASKRAAEATALDAARSGADVVVCRLFTVFGPRQRPDMAFARWISAITADTPVPWCAHPAARREFTYVDDAVRGLLAALEHGRTGEVYNLGGSGSTPVRTALAEIERLLGRTARLAVRPSSAEAVATAACGAKARRELGHVPRVSFGEGIERQLEATLGSLATAA